MLRESLEDADYQVQEAANGAEALKLCRLAPVDLVITDIFMPEKDGLEFIIELRRRNRLLPIIAISGGERLAKGGLHVAQTLGATAILPKPFTRDEILGVVGSALLRGKKTPEHRG